MPFRDRTKQEMRGFFRARCPSRQGLAELVHSLYMDCYALRQDFQARGF